MDQATLRVLLKSGLNEKQATVYLSLLTLGQGTVSQIAEGASLKRPLVYILLEELKQHGLVTELLRHAVKRFTTTDPRLFFKQQKSALEDLQFILPSLTRQHEKNVGYRPRVEVVEGAAGILRLYRRFGRALEARYISSYASLRAAFPDEVQQWIRSATIGKSTTSRYQLLVDEPEGRAFAEAVRPCPAWQIRFLPSSTKIHVNIDIVDDIVMNTHFHPLFATVTHSESLAKDYTAIFDALWRASRQDKKRKHPHRSR